MDRSWSGYHRRLLSNRTGTHQEPERKYQFISFCEWLSIHTLALSEKRKVIRQTLSLLLISLLGALISCTSEEPTVEIPYASDQFSFCNEVATARCSANSGDYCLFGFKFGARNNFFVSGINVPGPKVSGDTVTFSFQEENGTVNTHRQVGVPSLSFDELIACSKQETRTAMASWRLYADINFVEEPDNSDSDIKFFVSEISTGGVGFPNFPDAKCGQLAGHVIFHPDFTSECTRFYIYALHEIGHALGLGHSGQDNIMGANLRTTSLTGLQDGDIEGIQELYGER